MAGQTDKLEIEIIATDKASDTLSKLSGSLSGFGKAAGGAMLATAGLAVTGLGGLVNASLGSNAALETATLQFETLLGSADAANAHIQDLYKFGAETPFETGPIIAASKSLLTFGGTALDTMDNMRLFGNAAAVTGAGIDEVSYTMGRAYSAIQAGKPFGEAAARLTELGILTADTRMKLEQMSKEGASSSDIWNTLTGDFQRFDGAMEKQASTMDGLKSTISDVVGQTLGKAFQPFFESAKGVMTTVAAIVQGPEFAAMATSMATSLAPLAANFTQIAQLVLTQLGPALLNGVILPFIQLSATAGPPVLQLLGALLTAVAPLIGALVGGLGTVLTQLITTMLPALNAILPSIIQVLTTVVDVFVQLMLALIPLLPPLLQLVTTILPPLAQLFTGLVDALMPLVSTVLGILIELVTTVIIAIMPLISQILPPLAQLFLAVAQAITPLIVALLPVLMPLIQVLIQLLVPIIQLLMPVLVILVKALTGALQSAIPYIQQFANWISQKVVPAINGISNAIKPVIDWIGRLAAKLSNIRLPSWLTPGSPTPFEMGLRGISKAASQLATGALPKMAVGLEFGNASGQVPLSSVGFGGASGGGQQIVLQYSPTFSTVDAGELQNRLQPMLNQAIRDYNRSTK